MVFLAALAVVGLLSYGLLKKGEPRSRGGSVPDDALPRLDGSGTGSVADYRGRWVLVNVWASWCMPCRDESPALERFYARIAARLHDPGRRHERPHRRRLSFVRRYGVSYPQLHDGGGDFSQDELKTTGRSRVLPGRAEGKLVLHSLGPVTERYLDANVAPYIPGRRSSEAVRSAPLCARPGAASLVARGAAQPKTSLPDVEDEVMCPICGTALNLSGAPQADRERAFIRRQIAAGRTKDQIKDALVAQYGEEVLAEPPKSGFDLTAWLVPGVAIVVAAIAIALGLRRWRRAGRSESGQPPGAAPPLDPADAERLDADLARYDL